MGGIGGQIARDEGYIRKRAASYGAMLSVLRKRGADGEGIYFGGGAAILNTRLAVSDRENGGQPMKVTHSNRHYVITYNGEIYNANALRYELTALGHAFTSRSDTETLLRAYIQWGEDCLNCLSGMFAFAVWDEAERILFLARDQIGAKPLFYTEQDDTLIFASDIPSLLAHADVDAMLDENGIAELLFMGPGRTPGSGVLRGICELEPAECAVYKNGVLHKRRYWNLTDRECTDTFAQAVEKTRYLVLDSIENALNAEVPLCTFLSGGLDSSIISAVADKYLRERGKRLLTFSVGYRDNEKFFEANKFQPNSDEQFIKIMNAYLHAEHRDVTLDSQELVDALFDAADARGLPGMADVDASLLLFCRAVKPFAAVALSGEGADEIFGGYPWYRDPAIRNNYGFPWAQNTARRQTFLSPEYSIDGAEYVDARYRSVIENTHALAGLPPEERRIRELVNLHYHGFMQTLLDRKDRMSMHAGVEARMPYGDVRIVEYLYSLPWQYKDHNDTEKGLLRESMRGLLPDEVLWRKKSPYPKTHNPEYLALVSRQMRDLLAQKDAPLLRIVSRTALESLLTASPNEPWYGQLMTVPQTVAYFLQMNYWLERYNVTVV